MSESRTSVATASTSSARPAGLFFVYSPITPNTASPLHICSCTAYRGPLLIVASGRPHKHADEAGHVWTLPAQVQVCLVDLLDVRSMTRADEALAHVAWAPGLFAWRLANPRHVRPVAHRGQLNLYSTPDDTITLLEPDAHYLDHL